MLYPASSFAIEAVFGLAILLDVSLGRNIVHAFVLYAHADGSLADPWVPLHLVPTSALARYLTELAISELRMLKIILDPEHQSSTAFRYGAPKIAVRTMLVAPPVTGQHRLVDPRTRPLSSDAQWIINKVRATFEAYLAEVLGDALCKAQIHLRFINRPKPRLTL